MVLGVCFEYLGKGLGTDCFFFCETGIESIWDIFANQLKFLAMTVDLWNLGMLLAISQQKHDDS